MKRIEFKDGIFVDANGRKVKPKPLGVPVATIDLKADNTTIDQLARELAPKGLRIDYYCVGISDF